MSAIVLAVADESVDVEDAGSIGVKAVEAELVLDDDADEQAGANAEREADQVDARVEFVFPKLPQGRKEMNPEHGLKLYL